MRRYIAGVLMVTAACAWLGCRVEKTKAISPGAAAEAAAPKKVVGVFTVLGRGDAPLAAGVAVYDAGLHGTPRWEGLAGERYDVPPGRYDLLVEYYGQRYWRRGEDLAGGPAVIKLPMATLTVEARSSRGDELEGAVALFPAGAAAGEPPVMEGRTFDELTLLAGVYDARVTLQGRERRLRGVELDEGDRVTEAVVEPVGYLLATAVDEDGTPVPAEMWLYDAASSRRPAAVGESGKPLAVLPGRYDVQLSWNGQQDYSAGVAVIVNQTTEERFVFRRRDKP